MEETADSLTELINYKGDCRTAPATPGRLITLKHFICVRLIETWQFDLLENIVTYELMKKKLNL